MAPFVDTNILLYAFASSVEGEPEPRVGIAKELLRSLVQSDGFTTSTQVLGEFFRNSSRKGHVLTGDQATLVMHELAEYPVVTVDTSLVFRAAQRSIKNQINYYDALIVEAALRAGCSILYTEDLHHGMRFHALEVRNPFKS